MPYFGYIEVEVRDMRGTGIEGAMLEQHKIIVKIEDAVADEIVAGTVADESEEVSRASAAVRKAICDVRTATVKDDLRERWESATRRMTVDQMLAALEVLERG